MHSPIHKNSVGALAILVLLIAVWLGVDFVFYPWARALPGHPELVGDWYGELTTPTGRRQQIALNIGAYLGRCTNCGRVEATARVCDARGTREYSGDGDTQNWRGTKFHVGLFATDDRREGLRLIRLQGVWDTDTVQARVEFESGHGSTTVAIDAKGAVTRPGADPDTLFPVPLTLRRGADRDFISACRRLSSQAQPELLRRPS